jgi:hypothetical protein
MTILHIAVETCSLTDLYYLAAAAPCFTKRDDFPHGLDKSAVNDFICQTYSYFLIFMVLKTKLLEYYSVTTDHSLF